MESKRTFRLSLVASVALLGGTAALGTGVSAIAAPTAAMSRTTSLNETGHLGLTSRRGFTLNERGLVSGTVRGAIYIHLRVTSTNSVTAEVNIYPQGGSISGYARAAYHVNGATAGFSGSLSIVRGTGSYSHAHGSGLSFSGTIQRSNDSVTVHLRGLMSS